MERTTIYLPDELRDALREVAERVGRSQAELIREALTAYLDQQPRPPVRSLGLGEDSDLAARDTETWLDDAWGRG